MQSCSQRQIRNSLLASNTDRAQVERAQPPHESKLHDVSVDEEELHSATALAARDGLHGRVAGCGIGREKDVFQGAELWTDNVSRMFVFARYDLLLLTKKNAFAMKVYPKTAQPTQPPVPFPPLEMAATAMVTMTPTNL